MGGLRFGVFAQLITSFVLAVIFTVTAATVGILSIQKFNHGIEDVALSRLPAMTLAYQLGQQSEAIVASAPMLVRVNSQAQRETISFRIADRVRWLQEIVDSLRTYNVDANILEVINLTRQQLLENYARLDNLVKHRIDIVIEKKQRNKQLESLVTDFVLNLDDIQLSGSLHDFVKMLLIFETQDEQGDLEKRRSEIEAQFKELSTAKLDNKEKELIASLREIALGEKGLVGLQVRYYSVTHRIAGILAVNERLSNRFVYSVNDLIRRMREDIENKSKDFSNWLKIAQIF